MITPIKKMVIHIDFSQKSLNALRTAINVAKRHSAELNLLYVIDTHEVTFTDEYDSISCVSDDQIKSDILLLEDLARCISQDEEIICKCHCRIGLPVHGLADAASEFDCDLVVIPTDTHENALGYLFDDNAYRILKKVNCSILTVPSERKIRSFRNIIFPIRPNKDVAGKYNFSRPIFKKNNAKVILMGLLDNVSTKKTTGVSKMIKQFRRWMREDKIQHVAGVTFNSDPIKGTRQTGRDFDIDLVIINASTKRNILQFFFGSYTQKMLQSSDFAVLCYKPKKQHADSWEDANIPLQLALG